MSFTDLPVFLLLCAFLYLLVIYGLLTIMAVQEGKEDIISQPPQDGERQIKVP